MFLAHTTKLKINVSYLYTLYKCFIFFNTFTFFAITANRRFRDFYRSDNFRALLIPASNTVTFLRTSHTILKAQAILFHAVWSCAFAWKVFSLWNNLFIHYLSLLLLKFLLDLRVIDKFIISTFDNKNICIGRQSIKKRSMFSILPTSSMPVHCR